MAMNRAKTTAWIGAILVHIALVAVLIFSVRWKQDVSPPPVSVDIVAALTNPPPVDAPTHTPAPAPTPVPPLPPPTPPPPAPAKAPPPTPPAPPPVDRSADIARQKLVEKKKADDARVEQQKREDAVKKDVERKQADVRVRELKASQERALKEQQAVQVAVAQAEKNAREAAERAQAERTAREATERAEKAARDAAAARARAKAEADYVAKIRGKIRGNIIMATDPPGNIEAIFEVSQLPTGEIISAQLSKSSGNRMYDEAVERAILKSSPLPRPEQTDIFQRRLSLKFRPQE